MGRPHTTAAAIAKLTEQIEGDRRDRNEFRIHLESRLGRIEVQTEKTNGRVGRLESWRMFVLGGFVALSAPWAAKIVAILSAH